MALKESISVSNMRTEICPRRRSPLYLIFSLILVSHAVLADGRVVRGGGGYAELQTHYAMTALAEDMRLCASEQGSCMGLGEQAVRSISQIEKRMSSSPLLFHHAAECEGENPAFDFSSNQLSMESCQLYAPDGLPKSYDILYEMVLTAVCRSANEQLPIQRINCPQFLKSMGKDILTESDEILLYQEAESIFLHRLLVEKSGGRRLYVSLEFTGVSLDLTEELKADLKCTSFEDFEILGRRTSLSPDQSTLSNDFSIHWSCQSGPRPGKFAAQLLIEHPLDPQDLSDIPVSVSIYGGRVQNGAIQ